MAKAKERRATPPARNSFMTVSNRTPRVRKPKSSPIIPSKPLSKPSREIFAQLVAQGVPVPIACETAGYSGGGVSRSQLRRSPDVDARVQWLLAQRIEADTKARHRADEKIEDARLRLIRELERIAFCDPRDVMQWDRVPVFRR
ncbi:MAG TPA: hypothetical protein VJY34_11535 [Roseiarcus sp.]|nr:hypothetical protein [Roseiarcus sp.]